MYENYFDEQGNLVEYNKMIHEGYKARHFRKDGSVSSVSKIRPCDVENVIRCSNLGFIPQKFIRLLERPYIIRHACMASGVSVFNKFNCLYIYNTPVYYIGCPLCGTVYYYYLKSADVAIETTFKNMGIVPKRYIQLEDGELTRDGVKKIRHACKEKGIIYFNLIPIRNNNITLEYAVCPSCGRLYYKKQEEYGYGIGEY